MIECPSCSAAIKGALIKCTACGFQTRQIDGFESWAPELASANSGVFFDLEKFQYLANLENDNFWFQARNELIIWAIRKYFKSPLHFCEIGCGTGFVLNAIEKNNPETHIIGTELFVEGLKFAAQRCTRAQLVQLDARRIPYRAQFDVVGIFDVLEHIEDDEIVLAQIGKSLVNGGGLLITVPQHRWLWSAVDTAACHVRRYAAAELENKVEAAGFEILRSTSFVSLLLPAMIAARFSANKSKETTDSELKINSILNLLFRKIMHFEFNLIRSGMNFPFGGSRLIIARKKVK